MTTLDLIQTREFAQKLEELKKTEIKKVDDFFIPQLEDIKMNEKDNTKVILSYLIKKRAELGNRPLSQEELEFIDNAKNAEKLNNSCLELREKQLNARQEAINRAEKIALDSFTKDTATIIELLKNEIPLQIAILGLNVFKYSKDNPKELKEEPSAFFTDEYIKKQLQEILAPFLNVLKKKDEKSFTEAWELINNGIKNKNNVLIAARRRLMQLLENNPQENDNEINGVVKTTTKKADEITSGTTKLENKVFNPKDNPAFYNDSNEIQMRVGNDKKHKEKELLTIVSIDFNEMKKKGVLIPSEKWLTHFDREILCAASSLYEAGNNFITPKMIYQALSGNNKDVKMTPAMRNEIIKSIDKLMGTTIEINASAEMQAGWRQEAEYKSALLPCKRVSKKDIRINGQEVIDCIQILGSSPLYDYAKGINQISRASIDMLNAPVNNTPENITLKGYLLRTITSMKNPKSKLKPVIRYDTIYEYLGIENTDSKTKKRVRDRTKEILNFWVNEGLITDFEEEKEGKTFEKIKIEF